MTRYKIQKYALGYSLKKKKSWYKPYVLIAKGDSYTIESLLNKIKAAHDINEVVKISIIF